VRDLGAPGTLAMEVRDAIHDGLVIGPDLLVAGAPITTTGGHCWFMGGEADGELGVRIAVRERARAGVDWIKVMATGGMMTPGSNHFAAQYTVDELCALVEEAQRLGLPVAAHCHGTEGIERAVAAGVDTIEHCSFQSKEGGAPSDELIAAIVERGVAVSPTVSIGFIPWLDSERGRRRAAYLKRLVMANARMVMSTDCGIPNVPHEALAGGMAVFARMTGLSPIEVLRRATSESAAILGLDDRGVITEGKRADLLVVEGDPLTDLAALERVRLVIAGGHIVCDRRASG
jgi:imidazolonepropionase-like amidohydrolase